MHRDFTQPSGILALWAGVLLGPVIFLVQFEINFMLVPWACAYQWQWLIYVVHAMALLFAAGTAWIAWSNWQQAGAEWPGEEAGPVPRSRFMALGGLLLSALFLLAILAQGIASLILGACE